MIPLSDIHCHLLAGLDDGPRTDEESLEMCRLARAEGVQAAAATAHQSERWPQNTPERITEAARRLSRMLQREGVALTVFPCAEVMVTPETEAFWREGRLLGMGGRRQYLLIEMPSHLALDLCETVEELRRAGVRPILAHPERHPELLHDPERIEQLIEAGCLIQVSSGSLTEPRSPRDVPALKGWLRRGLVHFIASDGHSPLRRPPRMAAAYQLICRWAGCTIADRLCSTNGLAVLHGLPLRVPRPGPARAGWFSSWW